MSSDLDATSGAGVARRPLRFGLSPALSSAVARRGGDELGRLLSGRLGREVRPIVLADYRRLEESLSIGRVDFAWTPPASFIEVAAEGCGLLALSERGGRTAFEAALVVRRESALHEVGDLCGTIAAWVDPQSASGYVVPLAGIIETLGDERPLFSRELFAGSHAATREAVEAGRADFCATYAVREEGREVLDGGWLVGTDGDDPRLRPIAFMGPIPADGIAHSPRLPAADVAELREVLTTLHEEPEGARVVQQVFAAQRLVRGDALLFDALALASITVERYRARHPL